MPQYNPDAEAALEEVTIGLLADLGWDEKRRYFNKALAINPNRERAKKGLAALGSPSSEKAGSPSTRFC